MQTRRLFSIFMVIGGLLALYAASPYAAEQKPLDYRADDAWNTIDGQVLSKDGNWFAYSLKPEYGDPTLVVRSLRTGAEIRERRGAAPAFTDNSRYVIFTLAAPFADIEKARRAHKTGDDAPKSGLGILTLGSGAIDTVAGVKDYKLATHSGNWVAYLLDTVPPATATPTPSASPEARDVKKKADSFHLIVRNLETGAIVDIPNVSEYALAPNERYLAYATETPEGSGDGVSVRELTTGNVSTLASTPGRYTNLTFAPETDSLAFLSDSATYAKRVPVPQLFEWDASRGLRMLAARGTAGMPRGFAPDVQGTIVFSRDGSLLYLGVNAVPTPMPSMTPEPIAVDLWSWRDARLQSQQKYEASTDAAFTYAGVLHVANGRYTQLATRSVPQVTTNDNTRVALGSAPQGYYRERSWGDPYADYYIVSLKDGHRMAAGKRLSESCSLSPGGKYALCYDSQARFWYTVRASDGRCAILTKNIRFAFYNELNDMPTEPNSYGKVGWTAKDARVLIKDRYDIWSFDPDGGGSSRVTGGYGRRHHLRFSYQNPDPQERDLPVHFPMYLTALDDRTKDSSIYVIPNTSASTPLLLLREPRLHSTFLVAKNGSIVFTRESFRTSPDYWFADPQFKQIHRITTANPQMARYRWGTEHLIHYVADGKPLDGILIVPDNLGAKTKHPMMVYFYERLSDELHEFYPPAPGTEVNLSRYVSNGYVVLIPDIAYKIGHPGKSALHAVNAAVDTALKSGLVDPRRIGISGHSWGGYQVAYIVTQTKRYAAAEGGAAVANMTSAYGGIRWDSGLVREFQYEKTQSRIGATPWDAPALYLENSPLFHVRNVQTPYLTIANDADGAVPWYQGIEFLTALRRLNKEAYMFNFNGEHHGIKRGSEQEKYWTVHLDEFFDHFLLGKPTPHWMTAGVPYLHRGERDVRPLFGEKP